VDVNLSSDDETDVSADHKVSAIDDAGSVGAASIEANAPVPIMAGAPDMPKSPATDQVLVPPPSSRRGRKRPPNPQIDQVMSQVELPPYHGPCSPLDLVAIEIIF
jgi:hypothetical protein